MVIKEGKGINRKYARGKGMYKIAICEDDKDYIDYIIETKNPVFSERLPRECRNNQEINDFSTPSGTTFHFCFCNKNMTIL